MTTPQTAPQTQEHPELLAELEKIQAGIAEYKQQMAPLLDQRGEEIKALNQAREETGERIDQIGEKIVDLEKVAADLAERLERAEDLSQRPGAGGDKGIDFQARISEMLGGDAIQDTKEVLRQKGQSTKPMELKGPHHQVRAEILRTDVATDFAPPEQAERVSPPEWELEVEMLIPHVPTTRNSIEWLSLTGFNDGNTDSVSSITRSGTTATVTFASAHDYGPVGEQLLVTIAGANQAEYNGSFLATVASATTLTYEVSGSPATPATGTITAYEQLTWGAAASIAEGGAYPESRMQWMQRTTQVEKIGHIQPVTMEALDDVPGLANEMQQLLTFGLDPEVERQILFGTGTSNTLDGLLTQSQRLRYSEAAGPTSDTKLDAVARSLTLLRLAGFRPDFAALSPFDWEAIQLLKGTDEHYLWASVTDATGRRIWRINVAESRFLAKGQGLTGAMAQGAVMRDRMVTEFLISSEHSDYFAKDQLAMKARRRLALLVRHQLAFCELTFA